MTVEIGQERYVATATPLTGEDYAREWAKIKEEHSFFADYESKLDRTIPVVELVRR